MSAAWIHRLNNSNSRTHKEDVLKQALEASMLGSEVAKNFLSLARAAYDPFLVFNLRQVPHTEGLADRENPWQDFKALLTNLHARNLTGNAARLAVAAISHRFDSVEWNDFCAAVITKDLRAGISEKTLNKVLAGTEFEVPVFSCQLAKDSLSQPRHLKGKKRLEVKFDGVRALAVVRADTVTLYSRNGKVFENFPQIQEFILENRRLFSTGMSDGDFVLDGEIMGQSFQDLMRQAQRRRDAETTGMVYHVFDFMPLADFERGYWNAQQEKRLSYLDRAAKRLEATAPVQIVPGLEVDLDTALGHDIMRRFAENAVAEGYEGIMIKALDAPYECRRSTFWMKWKPTITVDLEVVAVEPGTGKFEDNLGALVCQGWDQEREISVNVGSGFTDDMRSDLWQNRDAVVGQTVEILCDAVTQNQDGTYSLRFPRFVRFRDDK